MLGLRREFADRHVFDHAPAQRAYCLVGHGDAPVLSEVVETPQSQDRTPRCAIVLAVSPAAAPYRASGLVLWPNADLSSGAGDVCCRDRTGPAPLILHDTISSPADRKSVV